MSDSCNLCLGLTWFLQFVMWHYKFLRFLSSPDAMVASFLRMVASFLQQKEIEVDSEKKIRSKLKSIWWINTIHEDDLMDNDQLEKIINIKKKRNKRSNTFWQNMSPTIFPPDFVAKYIKVIIIEKSKQLAHRQPRMVAP